MLAVLQKVTLGRLFTHTLVPLFTMQYKLVPAKGGDTLKLGKCAGLAKSNFSLLVGL